MAAAAQLDAVPCFERTPIRHRDRDAASDPVRPVRRRGNRRWQVGLDRTVAEVVGQSSRRAPFDALDDIEPDAAVVGALELVPDLLDTVAAEARARTEHLIVGHRDAFGLDPNAPALAGFGGSVLGAIERHPDVRVVAVGFLLRLAAAAEA